MTNKQREEINTAQRGPENEVFVDTPQKKISRYVFDNLGVNAKKANEIADYVLQKIDEAKIDLLDKLWADAFHVSNHKKDYDELVNKIGRLRHDLITKGEQRC